MMRLDRFFVGIIFANLFILIVHSAAHLALQILPSVPDTAFILAVILIGPVLALPLLRINRILASASLAVLMAASFGYGVWSHFLVAGPDHVLFGVPDAWWIVFAATSVLLGALELAGVVIAVRLFVEAARTP
ncbi:MAG: hypothetical protein L3J78_04290 [Thermoplasmata archaeon]|nr:hypothetical protein [Thermoplasmata archaeon]